MSSNGKTKSAESTVYDLSQFSVEAMDKFNTALDIKNNPGLGLSKLAVKLFSDALVDKFLEWLDGEMYSMYSYFDYDSPYFAEASNIISEYESKRTLFINLGIAGTAVETAVNGAAIVFGLAALSAFAATVAAPAAVSTLLCALNCPKIPALRYVR